MAFAAFRVTPARASSGVRPKSVQAMFKQSSNEQHGDDPGLQLVAIAISTPAFRKASTGGLFVSFMKKFPAGINTATTPLSANAFAFSGFVYSQWSSVLEPNSKTRSAPS